MVRYEPASQAPITTNSIVAAFRIWCQENSTVEVAAEMNNRKMGHAIAKRFGISSKPIAASLSDTKQKAKGFQGIFVNEPEKNDSREEEKNLFR